MNTPSDKNPIDQRLDELLKDVVTPPGLKDQLNKIPAQVVDRSTEKSDLTDSRQKVWMQRLMVASFLAASIVGVAVMIFANLDFNPKGFQSKNNRKSEKDTRVNTDSLKPDRDKQKTNTEPAIAKIQQQLERISDLRKAYESEVSDLELAQLNQQLDSLNRKSVNRLSSEEVESIVLAMTPETSLPLGRETDEVRLEMASVIKQYRGTKGAAIAERILEQISND